MPVDLTLLPKPLPALKKFNVWFWGILLLVFITISAIATFVISFFYTISNLLFVVGALVFPIFIWVFAILYAVYHRGYQESYIKQWNSEREIRRAQLIDYARRGLYVIRYSLITEHGQGTNANGVVKNKYAVTSKRPHNGNNPIAHSALALPINVGSANFYERLETLFEAWQQEYKSLFDSLPAQINIHVRLCIDTSNKVDKLETLWQKTLGKIVIASSLDIIEPKTSSTFIEQWLDDSNHDDDLLLIINAHLFSSPSQNEAESALLMLLAGEKTIKSLPQSIFSSRLVKIYRSEQTSTLNQTLDNTLLWGNVDDTPYDGVWYSGVEPEQNIEIMNYFNDIEFEHGHIFNIDTSIGYAKNSAYFLALALAIEHTVNTQNKQLIVIGKPKITASVVTSVIREQK